jgi:hypothetical protein
VVFTPENLYGAISAAVQLSCILLALIWMTVWQACLVGWVSGIPLCMVANCVLWKQIRADARRRGQNLRSKWPAIHGSDRKATLAEAKTKGLL